MMVKQTRIVFDLTDVKAIRFHCNVCGSEFVLGSLTDPKSSIPEWCPDSSCGQRWENPNDRSDNYALLRAVKALLDPLRDPTLPMTVRFEVDGEDEKAK